MFGELLTPGCSNLTRQMERFSEILWIYSRSFVWERARTKGLERGNKIWQVIGRTICHTQEGQLDLFNQLKASDWCKGWHKLHITTMASCHALWCFSLLSGEQACVVTFTFLLLHTIWFLKSCFLADGYMRSLNSLSLFPGYMQWLAKVVFASVSCTQSFDKCHKFLMANVWIFMRK